MGAKTELINLVKSMSEEAASMMLKNLKFLLGKNAVADDGKDKREKMLEAFGLWKDRDISLEKIRNAAWRRK